MRIIPSYLRDLNAMHEAEKTIIGYYEVFEDYKHLLSDIVWRDTGETDGFEIHSTAAQRAEAFLCVVRKWEDDQD